LPGEAARGRQPRHERGVVKTQIAAEPQPISVELDRTALVIIDMQRIAAPNYRDRGTVNFIQFDKDSLNIRL
jgi:hypothetical protein